MNCGPSVGWFPRGFPRWPMLVVTSSVDVLFWLMVDLTSAPSLSSHFIRTSRRGREGGAQGPAEAAPSLQPPSRQ